MINNIHCCGGFVQISRESGFISHSKPPDQVEGALRLRFDNHLILKIGSHQFSVYARVLVQRPELEEAP